MCIGVRHVAISIARGAHLQITRLPDHRGVGRCRAGGTWPVSVRVPTDAPTEGARTTRSNQAIPGSATAPTPARRRRRGRRDARRGQRASHPIACRRSTVVHRRSTRGVDRPRHTCTHPRRRATTAIESPRTIRHEAHQPTVRSTTAHPAHCRGRQHQPTPTTTLPTQ